MGGLGKESQNRRKMGGAAQELSGHQNAIKTKPKCDRNDAQMEPIFSQTAGKMLLNSDQKIN